MKSRKNFTKDNVNRRAVKIAQNLLKAVSKFFISDSGNKNLINRHKESGQVKVCHYDGCWLYDTDEANEYNCNNCNGFY
jgi:hypothetical protein